MTRTEIVSFVVPGEPASKERPRFGRGRTYTPKRTQDAETRVVDAFDLAYPLGLPIACEIGMRIDFYNGNRRRRDLDNMQKLILDALNRVAYEDDWQVAELQSKRHYSKEDPRTEITIWEIQAPGGSRG